MFIENLRGKKSIANEEGFPIGQANLFNAMAGQGQQFKRDLLDTLLRSSEYNIGQAGLCQQKLLLQLARRLRSAEEIERLQDRPGHDRGLDAGGINLQTGLADQVVRAPKMIGVRMRHHQRVRHQAQSLHLFENFAAHILIHPAIDKQTAPLMGDHPDIRASLNNPDIFLKLDQLHRCFPFFLEIFCEGMDTEKWRETARSHASADQPATRQPPGRLYQKGKYVAFFSASVYYSLNFQQLVVVPTQEEAPRR